MACEFGKTLCVVAVVASVALLGCGDSAADEDSSSSGSGTEDPSGDGDGDPTTTTTGDGDGDPSTGDGDGDPGCPPPDPPIALTLDGSWDDVGAPSGNFECMLEAGDGPAWDTGMLQLDGVDGGVDFLSTGADNKIYAAGWTDSGTRAAWVGAVATQGMGSWGRTWTYDGDAWGARGFAITDNGRLWLVTAPEHLLAIGDDGSLVDGPLEAATPGTRYFDGLATGDGNLLSTIFDRGGPPTCVGGLRVQTFDQATGAGVEASPAFFTTTQIGLTHDGAGGAWMAAIDLNEAGATVHHYDPNTDIISDFSTTNGAGYVIGGDLARAGNGDLMFALYSPGIVELHRYDLDGNQLWMMQVEDFGNEYGPPSLSLDGDAAVLAFDVEDGFTLARVMGDGTPDWAGRWACGGTDTSAHDVLVDGQSSIWVAGVQDDGGPVGWLGALN